ncbi:carbonic anhydrase family protein [Flavobacterium sp. I3-2]|uniref:carbonic anhydrase family protein n=1 Tax=Flavobacterium sp. I3-2 TaxID=2748319 RepID=UPI0015AC921A|nr:carbonic anhydrase family protein [Flavobacterium sp. I3-2]
MKFHTAEDQSTVTPKKALEFLKEGNQRFVENLKMNHDLLEQVNKSRESQFPFAIILSCIDSRTSAELIFDQGLGDIFSTRVAGNIINDDVIGSMEFACKMAGSKLIVVLGHSNCGAIKGACHDVKLGHLTSLLNKVQPSIREIKEQFPTLDIKSQEGIDKVAFNNVHIMKQEIMNRSVVLNEMLKNQEIGLVGAYYKVETGEVIFIDQEV